jgi:N-acetylmuramic acid 6-phosphate etherase
MDTELGLYRYRDAAAWPAEEGLAAMLDNQQAAIFAVRTAIPALAAAVTEAAARLRHSKGRLIYTGAGASGRLAVQDGVELNPTFGWPNDRLAYLIAGGESALVRSAEGAEDDAATGAADMAALHPTQSDVVISVAASGTTRYTRAVQSTARAAGAQTIGLANNPGAPLLTEAEHPILLHTGAEFLPGSTRMTAGTAQKIALNLFSTRLMTELGRIHRGLMVDMIPSNAKLVVRAHRMVATLTGLSEAEAAALWHQAGSVKIAVLMHAGLSRAAAEARLADSAGQLDVALAG